jgi:hypothetical protein
MSKKQHCGHVLVNFVLKRPSRFSCAKYAAVDEREKYICTHFDRYENNYIFSKIFFFCDWKIYENDK